MPPCVTEFTVTLICDPVQIQQALTFQINITTYTANKYNNLYTPCLVYIHVKTFQINPSIFAVV